MGDEDFSDVGSVDLNTEDPYASDLNVMSNDVFNDANANQIDYQNQFTMQDPVLINDEVYYRQGDGRLMDINGNPYFEQDATDNTTTGGGDTTTGGVTNTGGTTGGTNTGVFSNPNYGSNGLGNGTSTATTGANDNANNNTNTNVKPTGILGDAANYIKSKTGADVSKLTTPAGLLAGLGGLWAATGGNTPKTGGYKGSIPDLAMVRAPIQQAARTPYSGEGAVGQQYFTAPTYVNRSDAAMAQALADQQAKEMAPVKAAEGGLMNGLYEQFSFAEGGEANYLRGKTDGMADKLDTSIDGVQPAKLSHGEFVIPADVVSHLGNGNSDAGADALYKMMERVRKARTGNPKQGKRINPNKFTGGIAKYAEGGGVKGFDGTTGSTVDVTKTGLASSPYGYTQETSLAPWVGDYVTNMLGKGQALSNQPYQAYTGQMTAGQSPLQTQAFNTASNLTTPSGITAAGNTASDIASKAQGLNYNAVGSDFGSTQANQYMNPFLQAALAPQMAELQRQNQIANMGVNAKLAQSGGYGGGRQAVYNAENQRNMMQQMNQTLGQGYATAFDKAMAQFNADQARKTQEAQFGANYGLQGLNTALQGANAQGQMGIAQNQAQLANLGALTGLGAQQRGIEQEALTARQNEFNAQRENPYKMVQFQQSLLQGLPTSTTTSTPNLSPSQKIAAAGADMTKLYDLLKQIPGMGSVSQSDVTNALDQYFNPT